MGDQPDEVVEIDRAGHRHGGLRRPAAAHRDHHRLETAAGRQAGDGSGDRGLAGSLAGADDRERRHRQGWTVLGWVEPEVGADVGNAGREGDGDQLHPFPIAEHRLVGEVEDHLRREFGDRGQQRMHRLVGHDDDGYPEVGRIVTGGELLRPTHQERGHDLVAALPRHLQGGARDRRVVLTVHEGERSHVGLLAGTGMELGYAACRSRRETWPET